MISTTVFRDRLELVDTKGDEGLLGGAEVGLVGFVLMGLPEGEAVGVEGLVEEGLLDGVMEEVDGSLLWGRLEGALEALVCSSTALPYQYNECKPKVSTIT
jgi:hypothetical protein